jgi:N-acetylglucosaminyldiphosphoundecaprenol N-acetyl-beta-D-mannosaminyltransferase
LKGLPGLDLVQRITVEDLMRRIQSTVENGDRLTISSVGFHALNMIASSPAAEEVFRSLDVVLSDGIAVIWASRALDGRLDYRNRIGGDIVAAHLYPIAAANAWGVFCLGGGSRATLSKATANLAYAHPHLKIVGALPWYAPSEAEDANVVEEINVSNAAIVLVGLGQPRQEEWIAANKNRVRAAIFVAVGGYFEHVARQAGCYPAWAYQWHLNWAYRLLREPRRLWKRYTFGGLTFAAHVVRAKLESALRSDKVDT